MGTQKQATTFAKGMAVVYPGHGIGRVTGIETQELAGFTLELLVIELARNKMVLRIPKAKVASSGLRAVVSPERAREILGMLEGRARRSRALWSRRAQDYENKINSGDIAALAEVVRDLSRAAGDEASYSERTITETATERLVAELAQALDVTETEAGRLVATHLGNRPGRGAAEADAESEAA